MEDIKKTIEFVNSKEKLEVDMKYNELSQAIKKRDRFYKIVGAIFCLFLIAAIIFERMSLESFSVSCIYIVFLCVVIIFVAISYDISIEADFEKAYVLFCNTIDCSKDIYVKPYVNALEITYFTKEDGALQTCSITHIIDVNIRYIDSDNFKLVGRLDGSEYKITLYMPLKYNKDYVELKDCLYTE